MTKKKQRPIADLEYKTEDFYEVHHTDAKKEKKSIIDVRDRIGHIKDLLVVCQEAILYSELNDIKRIISDVIYFQVQSQLTLADEELKTV